MAAKSFFLRYLWLENKIELATPESIKSRIVKVRERCVIIDSDLAEMYGVETKNLKRAVRMNIERFPEDFMFMLTKEEHDSLRCNFFTLKNGRGQHSKYLPIKTTSTKWLQKSKTLFRRN